MTKKQQRIGLALQGASPVLTEMWLFWRILIFSNESFNEVNKLTLDEMIQYNAVLDMRDEINNIVNTPEDEKK